MGIFPTGPREIEQIVPVENIDPLTCRDKFKGDVDEHGVCLIRVRMHPSEPDKAELLRLNYISRGSKPEPKYVTGP